MKHLEAIILGSHELFHCEIAGVLEDAEQARAPEVEQLQCLWLSQLLHETGTVVLSVEREDERLHRPGIQMRDKLL